MADNGRSDPRTRRRLRWAIAPSALLMVAGLVAVHGRRASLDLTLGGYGSIGLGTGAGLGGLVGLAAAAVALGKGAAVRTLLLVGLFATTGVVIAYMLDPRDLYEARASWYVAPPLTGAAFGAAAGLAIGLRLPVSVGSMMAMVMMAGIAMGMIGIERGATLVMPLLALVCYLALEARRLPRE